VAALIKIIMMFALCLRYPGLKTPMVGGIDLVGRVLETKSLIPAQVGTETDAVGTNTLFLSLAFESLRAKIGSLVMVSYGTTDEQKTHMGGGRKNIRYLNRVRDPSIRLLHIVSVI
jgi:hypothetical protein